LVRHVRHRDPDARRQIKKLFGSLRPKTIRKLAFSSPSLRRRLERIVIPRVAQRSEEIFSRWFKKDPTRPIVYEAALLIETGRARDFKAMIVVHSPRALQMKRLIQNRGLKPKLAKKLIASQTSDLKRRKSADVWVNNRGDKRSLKRQAEKVFSWMLRELQSRT
jgi:dephospho-CoA kinase